MRDQHRGREAPAIRRLLLPQIQADDPGKVSADAPRLSQYNGSHAPHAKVAELADALDLGSSGETRGGSSPPFRTIHLLSASARLGLPFAGAGDPIKQNGRPAGRPFTKSASLLPTTHRRSSYENTP
jgi:hypothetical protein